MMFKAMPVPEIIENDQNHSFKFENTSKIFKNLPPRPPKLYPKHEFSSFNRSLQSAGAHAISFSNNETTPPIGRSMNISFPTPVSSTNLQSTTDLLLNKSYDRTKNIPYFEQCFEFENKVKIGEGSFAEVFQVKSKEDGKLYAVKRSKQLFRSECYRQERLQEVRRYEQFSEDPNCVKLYQAWEENERLFIQLELCKGSLEKYSLDHKTVPESIIFSILLDLLLALKGLHDKELIHLDIKLENVLLTEGPTVSCKLSDFGLVYNLNNRAKTPVEGDSRYVAPEIMKGLFMKSNDIFSLGITIFELASNLDLPPNGVLWQNLRNNVFPDYIMNSLSPELQSLIKRMMEPNPYRRPTVDELLQYPKIKMLHEKRKKAIKLERLKSWCKNKMISMWLLILRVLACATNWLSLEPKTRNPLLRAPLKRPTITLNEEKLYDSSDDENFQLSSMNSSINVSNRTGHTEEDDNNNASNITPTLNNSIPRITPETKIANSTPLNHHVNGFSLRKFKRDLSRFELNDISPTVDFKTNKSFQESAKDSSSIICKKLFSKDSDLDDDL